MSESCSFFFCSRERVRSLRTERVQLWDSLALKLVNYQLGLPNSLMDAKDGKLKARRDYSELHLTRISTSLANNSGGKTQQLEIVDGISPVTRIDSSLFHCKTNAVQRENSKKPTNEGGMEKVGTRMPWNRLSPLSFSAIFASQFRANLKTCWEMIYR